MIRILRTARPDASRTAGERTLPGGLARSFASFAIATLLLALPLAAGLAALRGDPLALPAALERALDPRSEGERAVQYAERRLLDHPDDPGAMTQLALSYLVRVRENGDPGYYSRAADLVARTLAIAPESVDAHVAAGSLALSRHDFSAALEQGRSVVRNAPFRPSGYGIVTDALVELGRYEGAVDAAQRMVDLRPDQPSLARVSYLRELHGDLDGAIDAMRRAVQAGAPNGEATAWTEVQLGHLLFAKGDLDGATAAYENARQRVPDYVYGLAGLARVHAARGDLAGAASRYEEAARRMPLPELVVALGDTYTRLGDGSRAERQYALVGAMQALFAANGVRVDLDLALFDLDHGREVTAALAAARAEYAVRPSVHVADALAWAEYRSGDLESALGHSREALRLGTRDPLMLYRGGVIAQTAGERDRAIGLLSQARALNPEFSILFAPDLAARLRALDAPATR